MDSDTLLVITTCADEASAAKLARRLVTDRLAACVNTIANVSSTYRWNDGVEQASECVLLVKTRGEQYGALEAAILENSAYELPEIVAVRIDRGLGPYLKWIDTNTKRQ